MYTSLSLTGPGGTVTQATEESNKELLALFASLLAQGKESAAIPDTHRAGTYTVIMRSETMEEAYTFYFSATFSTCYYTDPVGKSHQVSGETTESFLNSPFAFELYASAVTPTLTTAATDEVIPSSLSWNYRIQKGSFTQLNSTVTTGEILTYPIANDVAFYFSVQPSQHEVVIRHNGKEIYRGHADGISLTLQEHNELLDVEISATYNQDSRLDYYGTLFYRFRMEVVEAAHFSLHSSTATAGGLFLIECQNVKNAEKLELSAEPALAAEPVILERDGLVYAVLPASSAGAYSVRVTYGTISAVFSLTVTSSPSLNHSPDTSGVDWVTLLTQALPSMIEAKGAGSLPGSALVPHGTFLPAQGSSILSFGDTMTMAGTTLDATPIPFDLYHVDGNVAALSAGTVLEVGWDVHLGNYIIVDHGCGLYTWYCGLAESYMVAGNTVDRGDTLGYGGKTLYRENSVLIMATLGKATVSVDFLRNYTWGIGA